MPKTRGSRLVTEAKRTLATFSTLYQVWGIRKNRLSGNKVSKQKRAAGPAHTTRRTNRPALSIAWAAARVGICWNTSQQSGYSSSTLNTHCRCSAACRRWESEKRISLLPTWIRVGGSPRRSQYSGEKQGEAKSVRLPQ